MSELKPCPNCGKLDVKCEPSHYINHEAFSVICLCGTSSRYAESVEKAIKIWNTRPIEDALRAELEKTQKALELATKKDADTKEILDLLTGHLDYCGWGDAWERECAEPTQKALSEYMRKYYPVPVLKKLHNKSVARGGRSGNAENDFPAWNLYKYGDKQFWADGKGRAAKMYNVKTSEIACIKQSTKIEQLGITYFREDVYEKAGE